MSNPFARARMNMVDAQIRALPLEAEGIPAAFASLPREDFVSAEFKGIAYCDDAVPVNETRFLIAPHLLARMADAARISHTSTLLDIGAASGYSTALLARLGGCVIGLEEDPALVRSASQALARLDIDNAAVLPGHLDAGYPAEAPFDAILVTGGEITHAPEGLLEQLAPGGHLVYIFQGQLVTMTKTGDSFTQASLGKATAPAFPPSEDHNKPETTP
ncbi:MAG TPA: protein-L-isoaspartate O-methyltransferase [Rhodospirillaceae bacterium]|nr:MAG: hypothetical protein A2018_05060 [Alphaproteobacteria bacterium GWF2_58_20]HAU28886.1 protein-L-isoaspartate O-methyltransferase [Rhodospirillaceae bacterium]